jgi:hypothetical protein
MWPWIASAMIACGAHGDGAPGLWAPAELIWPWQEAGRLWEAGAALTGNPENASTWPKTAADICREPLFPGLPEFCLGKSRPRPAALTFNVGAYPLEKNSPWAQPFEHFTDKWISYRVDPEAAAAWTDLPPVLKLELGYPVSPRSFVYFRAGLRRDLSAWHEDPEGFNLPLSKPEVDLNEPSMGYFHAENDYLAFTLGRFPVHWSPSPDFGVTLSNSIPYHNAAEIDLKTPRVRYRFLVSSFNPWLEGTPAGGLGANGDYPVGSEEWLQRHYPDEKNALNAHRRVYDARIKTLFAHRLEGRLGPLAAGITEVQIIGGKFPDLRDANPFAFFHNDFKDGYVNSGLSFDGLLRLPAGFSLAAELFLDDVQYKDTEGDENTPSLLGYLAEIRHSFARRGWTISQSLDLIRTDPFLYGYLQPYNTLYSRQVLTTNFSPGPDSLLVDKLVVDRPVGYFRGGDAFDVWYRLRGLRGPLSLSLSVGVLAKGEVDAYTPYENYYSSPHDSPTGTAQREVRIRADGSWRWRRGLEILGGVAWQGVNGEGHVAGAADNRLQASSGVSWSLPY